MAAGRDARRPRRDHEDAWSSQLGRRAERWNHPGDRHEAIDRDGLLVHDSRVTSDQARSVAVEELQLAIDHVKRLAGPFADMRRGTPSGTVASARPICPPGCWPVSLVE
jgi:hypothetical protein